MLIDRNEINNTFEMTPEMLFGNYILGWKQLEDEDNPAVFGMCILTSWSLMIRPRYWCIFRYCLNQITHGC